MTKPETLTHGRLMLHSFTAIAHVMKIQRQYFWTKSIADDKTGDFDTREADAPFLHCYSSRDENSDDNIFGLNLLQMTKPETLTHGRLMLHSFTAIAHVMKTQTTIFLDKIYCR